MSRILCVGSMLKFAEHIFRSMIWVTVTYLDKYFNCTYSRYTKNPQKIVYNSYMNTEIYVNLQNKMARAVLYPSLKG